MSGHTARAAELRRRIRAAGEGASERELRELWQEAQREMQSVRRFGDLAPAAFFAASKPQERERKRSEYAHLVARNAGRLPAPLADMKPPLAPFHWELEFPEVFNRENPGFDSIVGNPPFAGKNTVAKANVAGYPDWLKQMHAESHGNADLAAHFFRRSFAFFVRGVGSASSPRTPSAKAIRARPVCAGSARTAAPSTTPAAGSSGPERRPLSSAWSTSPRGFRQAQRSSTAGKWKRSPRSCSIAAATRTRRGSRPMRGKAFRAASFSAWASPSTTRTVRALPLRSPRCSG